MKNAKMVRALKDKNFRSQLSSVEEAQLNNRVGIAEIDDSLLLNSVSGAASVWGKSHYPTLCCACAQ